LAQGVYSRAPQKGFSSSVFSEIIISKKQRIMSDIEGKAQVPPPLICLLSQEKRLD
jgi:hypothetical protein